jgi:osmotically-inducible protein OsmY
MTKSNDCDPMTINDPLGGCAYRLTVEQRLGATGYLALRRIHCECRGGVLSLRGSVPSNYLKQVAQAIADDVTGVRRVDNQLRVRQANARGT